MIKTSLKKFFFSWAYGDIKNKLDHLLTHLIRLADSNISNSLNQLFELTANSV